jgi:hypothetical protein
MGTIKDYKINDKDLFLVIDSYWTFEPNRQDSIQTWHLTNVTERDLDIEKLDDLKNYKENVDIEDIEKIGNKFIFKVYCDWTNKEFVFECDKIETSQRPYNEIELTEIILRLEKNWKENTSAIYNQKQFIANIKSNVSRQIEAKLKIIGQVNDLENMGYKKAKIQLDVLHQIDNFLKADENEENHCP